MNNQNGRGMNRRLILSAAGGFLAAAATGTARAQENSTEFLPAATGPTNNISSFRMPTWQEHFQTLKNGAILADLTSRAVHFWGEDGVTYRLYPSSVPLSEDLTRRGHTEVIQKVVNPPWRPTASMKERNPEWPDMVPGGAPDNPLGTRALYLGWPAYRIHGTHDTRKIGRRSSNGCVGLYNEHIEELFTLATVGTQVLLI
ncbi:L,D-transpeptidase [Fuscibacter oryzae]|uniref:L,D-transpeptidase n=1 Tax=Fuscibacter oryzae TaxID=2803939 RepID=A0A8J7MS88_9RHOB|nr:L,D-transpeptidase [Fuscibacter oryzae]MBL4929113.1 L,D-transpeptidase [Fuscibacter oryzae]